MRAAWHVLGGAQNRKLWTCPGGCLVGDTYPLGCVSWCSDLLLLQVGCWSESDAGWACGEFSVPLAFHPHLPWCLFLVLLLYSGLWPALLTTHGSSFCPVFRECPPCSICLTDSYWFFKVWLNITSLGHVYFLISPSPESGIWLLSFHRALRLPHTVGWYCLPVTSMPS